MIRKYKFILIIILTASILYSIPVLAVEEDKIKTDVLVYTAEPEGIAAAVAAARDDKKVLLVLTRKKPGGLMTYAALNFLDLNYDQKSKNINHGIFSEWHQKVGGGISFSPQKAESVFLEMINNEKNIKMINSAVINKVYLKNNKIDLINIKTKNKVLKVEADIFIDASQDGDLADKAGEDYFIGTADMGLENSWMASTQILKFSNVNPEKLKSAVKNYQYKSSYFKDDHAWGFSDFGKSYQSQNPNMRLRGLNIVFIENDNSYDAYINALLLFDVNPLVDESLENAKREARIEAKHVLKYLKNNLAGFAEAEINDLPPELYKRESRHFLTEYQLKVQDLFRQKIFADTVTLASYPLDYQAADHDYPGFVLFNPEYYAIPLRSLIARKNTNLLIIGRSSGYSSLAAASARVLPVGINTGEAAGIAASEAIDKDLNIIEVAENKESINKIQQRLNINLNRYQKENAIIKDSELLPSLEKLLSWGITIGGYNNNFKLNIKPSEKEFTEVVLKKKKKKEAENLYEWVPGSLEFLSENKKLTTYNALKLLLAAESQRVLEIDRNQYFEKAVELNLLPDSLKKLLQKEQLMSRKEMIILAAHYLDRFQTPPDLKYIRGEYFE